MGGRVLELESERLLRVGREEGMERGMMETAKRMLRSGRYTMEEIISISGLSENEIKNLTLIDKESPASKAVG